ncbi:hypothetical protein JCM8202_005422 [Rhodotorula sphaerocarpa]
MSTESLGVAASIWSRLPNEEQYSAQPRGRHSPSARSTDSASSTSTSHRRSAAPPSNPAGARFSSAAPSSFDPARKSSPHLHQQQDYPQQPLALGSQVSSRDFAPSPRSSTSTSGGSFPPTPDSSTSPHGGSAGTKVLAPVPPGAPPASAAKSKRFSPPFSSSLGLYQDPVLEASEPATASEVPAAAPVSPAASATPSSQPLLAEVFAGNPRPHYRPSLSTSALAPHQQYRPPAAGGSLSVDTSPYPLQSPALPTSPIYPDLPGVTSPAPSYFSPPPAGSIHSRGRSASVVGLERPPTAMPISTYGSQASAYAMADPYHSGDHGASFSGGADQHGWKPSGSGTISASLPTVSAVGSPSRGSALPHPSSSSVARAGGPGAYSPFGWNEDSAPLPGTAPGTSDRDSRSRFRDLWGGGGTSTGSASGAGLSTSAGSTGGIGMSNMSPFSRDGSKLELDSWSGLTGLKSGGVGSLSGGGPHGRLLREHSLGAVGSGRKRSDASFLDRPALLREVEDEERAGEDADVFHQPTKSGATSRRHSFAAFDPPNRGATTQIGFHLPPDAQLHASNGGGFEHLAHPASTNAWSGTGSGGFGSSAINDDDLAADLNSLQLNLEVAAASNEPPRAARKNLHVGSMPANFPPPRGSRALEHSRSPPPPPRDLPAESSNAPAHAQPQPQGSSPRATAEPFTPGMSSTSTSSRFLLQGLQAPTPLPPATTQVVATASPGPGATSRRFDGSSPVPPPPYPSQSGGNRFGQFGGSIPPPAPPITTQHQYFTPATAAPSLPSPRGPPGPGQFPGFGPAGMQPQHHLPGIPPPPVAPAPQQHQQPPLSYFNAPPPPPPGMPQLAAMAGPPAMTAQAQTDMNLGRGVPLHAVPPGSPLCIVGFKAGRKDLFFCEDPNLRLEEGDLVIVEADRGRDVGKFLKSVTVDEVHKFQQHLVELALGQLASGGQMPTGMTGPASMGVGMGHDPNAGAGQGGAAQLARMTKECQPKRIFAKAGPADTHALLSKAQDEVKALALVRSKVAQKGLPMEILDAEWQWDRRKLTFYYTAEQRVDFRELVRELFRIWKTRVWLCCLDQQQPSFDIQ